MSFTEKPSAKLSHLTYACSQLRQPRSFQSAAQRSCATYEAEDGKLEVEQRRRNGLVANLASASAPRTDVIDTLVGLRSPASTVSAANLGASSEHIRCGNAGLDAVASALAGAVTAVTGAPSGVASHDAPVMSLAVLSSRHAESDKQSAKWLREAAVALEAPEGSRRLYVFFVPRSLLPYNISMPVLFGVFLLPMWYLQLTPLTYRKNALACCTLFLCTGFQVPRNCQPRTCQTWGRHRNSTGSTACWSSANGPGPRRCFADRVGLRRRNACGEGRVNVAG